MAFKVFTLLINGLVPVIPAWFIMNSHPETAVIKPWPIVWTLLGVNVLFILIAWKHLGYTVSCRLYGLSRLKLHRIGSDASDNAKPRSEPCRANSTLNPERRF